MDDRAGVDWRQVARGVTWIGVGALLLLNTTGQLRWSFWLDALFYWPVLLIALGLRLIFERSSVPWAALSSPALVLGTLIWVAWAEPSYHLARWSDLRADRPPDARAFTLDGSMAAGRIELIAGGVSPGALVEGRAASEGDPRLRVSERRGVPRVVLDRRHHRIGIVLPWKRERWELALAPDLELSVDLYLALTSGMLDLRIADVERIRLQGAVNDLELRLGRPLREASIDLEGAFNRLDVEVPESVPVRIRRDGLLNLGRSRAESTGAGPGYTIRVEGAFNRISIRRGAAASSGG